MVASKNGIAASVQTLLNGGAHVDQIGNHGETALKLAASSGHIFILGVLIDAGAMIDMTKFRGGQTALMWAAMAGKTAIVRKLLQAGADPDLKTDLGHKALDYAKERRHDDIVELLRTAGKATGKPRKNLFRKWFG
jgi:ankyrin repeat protein